MLVPARTQLIARGRQTRNCSRIQDYGCCISFSIPNGTQFLVINGTLRLLFRELQLGPGSPPTVAAVSEAYTLTLSHSSWPSHCSPCPCTFLFAPQCERRASKSLLAHCARAFASACCKQAPQNCAARAMAPACYWHRAGACVCTLAPCTQCRTWPMELSYCKCRCSCGCSYGHSNGSYGRLYDPWRSRVACTAAHMAAPMAHMAAHMAHGALIWHVPLLVWLLIWPMAFSYGMYCHSYGCSHGRAYGHGALIWHVLPLIWLLIGRFWHKARHKALYGQIYSAT